MIVWIIILIMIFILLMKHKNKNMAIENRKAKFNYSILETYTAGIELFGSEVVSLRNNTASISESYCIINNGECFINNMYIKNPKNIQFNKIEETRQRKLLLHKKEIIRLNEKINQTGITLIPLKVIIQRNLFKVVIGLAKGKKLYDKRETIKTRDIQRNIEKQLKYFK